MENNTQQEVKDEFLKVLDIFDLARWVPFPGKPDEPSDLLMMIYISFKAFESLIKRGIYAIVFKNEEMELTSVELAKELTRKMRSDLDFLSRKMKLHSKEEPSIIGRNYREDVRDKLLLALTEILVEAIELQKNEMSK